MDETVLVLIKFRVTGKLRFLSHSETMRVFQRACARAGVQVLYSQGYNPRPKLSLPLPRNVGVETEDDLLAVRVRTETFKQPEQIRSLLAQQMPRGIDLREVETADCKVSLQPERIEYRLEVLPQYADQSLNNRIRGVLSSESLNMERKPGKRGKRKQKDVIFHYSSFRIQ